MKFHILRSKSLFPISALCVISLILPSCGGSNHSTHTTTRPENARLVPVQSDKELETYLKQGLAHNMSTPYDETLNQMVELDSDQGSSAPTPAMSFSGTNLQEAGVDEADIAKYDGDYLYVVTNPPPECCWAADVISTQSLPYPGPTNTQPASIRILRSQSQPPSATEVATLTWENPNETIDGLYLHARSNDSKRLVALSRGYSTADDPWLGMTGSLWRWSRSITSVNLIDIDHPGAPAFEWRYQLEGELVSSRVVDGTLYLVSRFTPYIDGLQPATSDSAVMRHNQEILDATPLNALLPKATTNEHSAALLVSSENCYVPENTPTYYATLVTITSINLNAPDNPTSTCVAGYYDTIYASPKALYLAYQEYDATTLQKLRFTAGGAAYEATGQLEGNLGWNNASFRFSEFADNLRILTSVDNQHRLFILHTDPETHQFNTLSQLPNAQHPEPIGKPDESVYGARFNGERGYVVTFRRTDPLYVLNLSDPTAPSVAGQMTLPGFSDYLHPIGNDLLLGVGHEADENGFTIQGVKVALFNIADPAQPQTLQSLVFGEQGSYSALQRDHKAFTFLATGDAHYRFAIPMVLNQSSFFENTLQLFELDGAQQTLTSAGAMTAGSDDIWSDQPRSVLHQDLVHYIMNGHVWSANWLAPGDTTGPQ